jgi:S1-C subfamily serine protease
MNKARMENRFVVMVVAASLLLAVAAPALAQQAGTQPPTKGITPSPQPAAATAATTAPARPSTKGIRRGSGRVIVTPQSQNGPTQVVTIVHQLSGFQSLRLLLQQAGGRGALATLNWPFAMTNDAHLDIVAGVALDDGRTIAAWLPQAATEFDSFPVPGLPPRTPKIEGFESQAQTAPAPNVSVVFSNGRRVLARYIGLDGATGLSVMQVNLPAVDARASVSQAKFVEGQRVRLFAPQRAGEQANPPPETIYVRIGDTEAKVDEISRLSSGQIERFTAKVAGAALSPAFVGSVALDDSGATVGIVQAVAGNQARILSEPAVQAAVRRVLDRQASVPRPFLGVSGAPAASTARGLFLANGWQEKDLSQWFDNRQGILLTSIVPGTPAAQANLRAGDVIIGVNEALVKSADDFSALLSDAGSGTPVNLSVVRPTHQTPEAIAVKLAGSDPFQGQYFENPPFISAEPDDLLTLGIQTVALPAKVAIHFGAQGGLLVIAVRQQSTAARGGMREGDIVESIDGHTVPQAPARFTLDSQKKHFVTVVRDRQRVQVSLEAKAEAKP